MTSQEPKTPQSADRDIPDTEAIVVSAPTPVFVDSTGRRRRLLRRLSYAFGAICMLYGGLISVSLAGGPVSSSAILPLPDLPDHEDPPAEARPSPTPDPTVSTPPRTRFIIESLPRRSAPVTAERRLVAPRAVTTTARTTAPTKKPPTRTPTPGATTTRPIESTTTPSTSSSPAPTASASAVPPKPPATLDPGPSATDGGTGGGAGGSSVKDTGLTPPTEAPASPAGTEDAA